MEVNVMSHLGQSLGFVADRKTDLWLLLGCKHLFTGTLEHQAGSELVEGIGRNHHVFPPARGSSTPHKVQNCNLVGVISMAIAKFSRGQRHSAPLISDQYWQH